MKKTALRQRQSICPLPASPRARCRRCVRVPCQWPWQHPVTIPVRGTGSAQHSARCTQAVMLCWASHAPTLLSPTAPSLLTSTCPYLPPPRVPLLLSHVVTATPYFPYAFLARTSVLLFVLSVSVSLRCVSVVALFAQPSLPLSLPLPGPAPAPE